MKQHIDTAPVWESYRQDCECPMCLLHARSEAANVGYFLGESVMEPSQRIEVNNKGFCAGHFKQMYDAGNRLGLALMTHTYMQQTIGRLEEIASQTFDSSDAAAEDESKEGESEDKDSSEDTGSDAEDDSGSDSDSDSEAEAE